MTRENRPDWSLKRFEPQDYGEVLAMNLQLYVEAPNHVPGETRRMVTEPAPSLYYGMYVDAQLVGRVSLTGVENGRAHLAYDILPGATRNRGYATWAARTMASYAFNGLGLDELVACVRSENEYSKKVLERTGFKSDGPEFGESWRWYRLANPNT